MLKIILLILVIVIIVLYKAAKFIPKEEKTIEVVQHEFEKQTIYEHLSNLIQVNTVSKRNFEECEKPKFEELRELLDKQYPNVLKNSEKTLHGNTGVCYHIKGKDSSKGNVLMAHYDVVDPGDYSKWDFNPFCGTITKDKILGRGTLDTKGTLLGVLEGTEYLLIKGKEFKNDLYLCFSGDEEVGGTSADAIVDYLKEINANIEFVIDEGGAIVENIFPTVTKPIAAIGIGEKGSTDVDITLNYQGGHASTPKKHSAVGYAAMAVTRIENIKFKSVISEPFEKMLNIVGRNASFGFRIVLANQWLFKGLLKHIFTKQGGEMAAMCHTTTAVTMIEGSPQYNVMPESCKIGVNYRILNIDSVDDIENKIKHSLKDLNADVKMVRGNNATAYADVEGAGFVKVKAAINKTWPDVIVSPYLMVACSDSRHYSRICKDVLKFSAMTLSLEERHMIHNYNEQITQKGIIECINFYINLIDSL